MRMNPTWQSTKWADSREENAGRLWNFFVLALANWYLSIMRIKRMCLDLIIQKWHSKRNSIWFFIVAEAHELSGSTVSNSLWFVIVAGAHELSGKTVSNLLEVQLINLHSALPRVNWYIVNERSALPQVVHCTLNCLVWGCMNQLRPKWWDLGCAQVFDWRVRCDWIPLVKNPPPAPGSLFLGVAILARRGGIWRAFRN